MTKSTVSCLDVEKVKYHFHVRTHIYTSAFSIYVCTILSLFHISRSTLLDMQQVRLCMCVCARLPRSPLHAIITSIPVPIDV